MRPCHKQLPSSGRRAPGSARASQYALNKQAGRQSVVPGRVDLVPTPTRAWRPLQELLCILFRRVVSVRVTCFRELLLEVLGGAENWDVAPMISRNSDVAALTVADPLILPPLLCPQTPVSLHADLSHRGARSPIMHLPRKDDPPNI